MKAMGDEVMGLCYGLVGDGRLHGAVPPGKERTRQMGMRTAERTRAARQLPGGAACIRAGVARELASSPSSGGQYCHPQRFSGATFGGRLISPTGAATLRCPEGIQEGLSRCVCRVWAQERAAQL